METSDSVSVTRSRSTTRSTTGRLYWWLVPRSKRSRLPQYVPNCVSARWIFQRSTAVHVHREPLFSNQIFHRWTPEARSAGEAPDFHAIRSSSAFSTAHVRLRARISGSELGIVRWYALRRNQYWTASCSSPLVRSSSETSAGTAYVPQSSRCSVAFRFA